MTPFVRDLIVSPKKCRCYFNFLCFLTRFTIADKAKLLLNTFLGLNSVVDPIVNRMKMIYGIVAKVPKTEDTGIGTGPDLIVLQFIRSQTKV